MFNIKYVSTVIGNENRLSLQPFKSVHPQHQLLWAESLWLSLNKYSNVIGLPKAVTTFNPIVLAGVVMFASCKLEVLQIYQPTALTNLKKKVNLNINKVSKTAEGGELQQYNIFHPARTHTNTHTNTAPKWSKSASEQLGVRVQNYCATQLDDISHRSIVFPDHDFPY